VDGEYLYSDSNFINIANSTEILWTLLKFEQEFFNIAKDYIENIPHIQLVIKLYLNVIYPKQWNNTPAYSHILSTCLSLCLTDIFNSLTTRADF
jgi:hypothetical protein